MPGIKGFHLTYRPYRDIIEKMKDLVDIFAGSNTTGAVAESSSRRWIAFEKQQDYLVASAFRFLDNISESEIKAIYEKLLYMANFSLPKTLEAQKAELQKVRERLGQPGTVERTARLVLRFVR